MDIKRIVAVILAVVMCLAVPVTALAAVKTNDGVQLFDVNDESTTENNPTQEPTTQQPTEKPADESTTNVDKSDVIALLIKFLSTIKLDEVKDALNDINEALGLPRVENFSDMAAYADALYSKLEDMGLGYDEIINSITSSDFIQWLNGLIFGKGDNATTKPVDSVVDEDETDENGNLIPDTGIAYAATGAAVAALAVSASLVFVLRKREADAE